MPRRVFTASAIKIIREMAEQAKSATQIAKVIGSTPASVRATCCQHRIKLKRGRPNLQPRPPRSDEKLVLVCVRSSDHAALAEKAAQMQKSTAELASMLLTAIVSSDIYEAVSDQRE